MRRNVILVAALAATVFLSSFAPIVKEDDKRQQEQQILVAVGKMLIAKHYHPRKIDDIFSTEVWNAYLAQLDPDKQFFLQEDITALEQYRVQLDEEIAGTAPIAFFNAASTLFAQRVAEVATQYQQDLSTPMRFDVKHESWKKPDHYPADKKERAHNGYRYLKYLVLRNLVLLQEQQPLTANKEAAVRQKTQQQLNRSMAGIKVNLTEEKQFNAFVNVIVRTMDPHTDYFPPAAVQSYFNELRNRFIGIGVQLQQEDGITKIVSLEPGGPAEKSGQLHPGDQLLQIGADTATRLTDIDGMMVSEISALIRGEKGTVVKLMLKREAGALETVSLTRDEIVQEEGFARAAIIRDGERKTGYVMLPKFYTDPTGRTDVHCAKDMATAITALKAEKVNGIILDLRSNGGGSLDEVIRMVGLFIKAGPVVQVKDNTGNIVVLKDQDSSLLYDGPLTVMVNEMSASAAEIFAAAIQDYHRGIIIGSSATYGKGTVQSTLPLGPPEAGLLKLTIQQFYRINGGSTQIKGVVPDIVLPDVYDLMKIREKDNADALPWDQIAGAEYTVWNTSRNVQEPATDTIFSAIRQLTQQLSATAAEKPLNLAAYTTQQHARQEVQKKLQQLQKLPAGKELDIIPVNNASIHLMSTENYQTWINKLKPDIYIAAALRNTMP
ncbi:carboxy terminal-processing peptidase [Chitinophaga arvensicola]|uniref:Carboxyl-terminal processing protease n=1 Tax=Chitinophaga arvensicola TaxID=29529 RepID=A0A1I0R356_9BACT|nr:carboxy terminal-processing peptidase [Chitinophaga arvensicola]SEW34796.1 carboxyl-terminal processing protease [Chitinophaga arvensicola]